MSNTIDEDPTAPVSGKRWRRFAMDRLYVNECHGPTIGWLDLKTGERRGMEQ
jgi:hypothetical protein